MKGWFAGFVGFAIVIGLLVIAYVTQATWEARAHNSIPVYDSKGGKTPAFSLRNGDIVRVLWDMREGNARFCYVRTADGRRGWSSCNELQPVTGPSP